MLFFADMGISPTTVAALNSVGHDAVHARDYAMQSSPDIEIIERARRERRVVLTADLDFGYLMAISNAALPSIVLFRLSDMRPDSIYNRLAAVLNSHAEQLNGGAFVAVTDQAIRARMLPFGSSPEPQ